jgi:hypothetical protein
LLKENEGDREFTDEEIKEAELEVDMRDYEDYNDY